MNIIGLFVSILLLLLWFNVYYKEEANFYLEFWYVYVKVSIKYIFYMGKKGYYIEYNKPNDENVYRIIFPAINGD